jgi:hypothetical protein
MSLESLRQQLGVVESFTCFLSSLCFVLYFCFAKGLAKAKCGVLGLHVYFSFKKKNVGFIESFCLFES